MLPLCLPYILLYACFYQYYLIFVVMDQKLCYKKSFKKEQDEKIRQIAYVQISILPQGGQILHGQCPCISDIFRVLTGNTGDTARHCSVTIQLTQTFPSLSFALLTGLTRIVL